MNAVGLVFVLAAAEPAARPAPATLSEQLTRLDGVLPVAARDGLAAASSAQIDEFDTEDMSARVLDGGALRRSRLGRELARRGIDHGRDLSWFMRRSIEPKPTPSNR